MPLPFFVQALIVVALTAVLYLISPKPKMDKLKPADKVDVPNTEIGKPLAVIFGTVMIRDPNVVWFGDLKIKAVKKKSGK